jgi:hypothetical protein
MTAFVHYYWILPQVCLVIARLHFPVIKSAGQVCQACPIKVRNGCSQKKIHTDFKSDHVWSCLIMSDHVWSCLIMSDHVWSRLIMSDQVSDHVWSCLIMFDQLSSVIVPSLTKGRHNNTNNTNNKARIKPLPLIFCCCFFCFFTACRPDYDVFTYILLTLTSGRFHWCNVC